MALVIDATQQEAVAARPRSDRDTADGMRDSVHGAAETEPAVRVLPDDGEVRASRHERVRGPYPSLVKPILDRLIAAPVLVASAPVMLALGIAVAAGVGRPVIFKQRRVGLDGQLFTVYKFRTMARDARSEDQPFDGPDRRVCHKRDDDPRLTPVGRMLRRWSLDELPQLWNVIRGEMSVVGPRPELPAIVNRFAPWQHERHTVKPGLTGFWQVYARGDGTVMHERTELDIAYVRRVGLITDLKVMLLTIPAVAGVKRGY